MSLVVFQRMAEGASLRKEVEVLYSKTQSNVSSILSNLYRTQAYLEATELMPTLKQKHENLLRVESMLSEAKDEICEFLKNCIISEGKVKELKEQSHHRSASMLELTATPSSLEPPMKRMKANSHITKDGNSRSLSSSALTNRTAPTVAGSPLSRTLATNSRLVGVKDTASTGTRTANPYVARPLGKVTHLQHSPSRLSPVQGAVQPKPDTEYGAVMRDRRVTNTKNKTCPICNKFFLKPSILTKHMRTHDPNRPKFTCYYCLKDFLHSETVYEHWRRFHSDAVLLKCLVKNCKLHFQTLKYLKNHMTSHRTCVRCGIPCTVLHQCEEAAAEKWRCTHEECDKKFGAWEELLQHLTNDHYYLCDVCSICFILKPNFDAHMSIFHGGLRPYACPMCSSEFDNVSDFKAHFSETDKTDVFGQGMKCQLFGCNRCGKTFDAISKMLEHTH